MANFHTQQRNCRYQNSPTIWNSPPPFMTNNRLIQCLQSIVCPMWLPTHGSVQFAIHRGVRLVWQFSSKNCPSPSGIVTPRNTMFLRPSPLIIPKWHLDWFSRFVWISNLAMHCQWGRKPPKTALHLGISSPCRRMIEPLPWATSTKNLSHTGTEGRLFKTDVCANFKVTWHKNSAEYQKSSPKKFRYCALV